MERRFCQYCAGALRRDGEGPHLICTACGAVTYRNPTVGVAVIVVDDERILLGRRARGRYAGRWCIPCGHVEWDEDIRTAARREFLEETGLDVALGAVFTVQSNFHDRERQTVGVWFHGHVSGGEARAQDDLDAIGYFDLHAVPELAFPTDALVIAALRGSLRA